MSAIPIGKISANFDLQVTTMLPTKFRISWLFGSGEEAKNRFSRWPSWRPSWISDRNDFSYFFIYKSPRCFLPSFESIGLLVQEKKQTIYFQDGGHVVHLGFPIITILATFDLQVTRCFLPSFESIGPLVQEKKRKIDFQAGGHLGFYLFLI